MKLDHNSVSLVEGRIEEGSGGPFLLLVTSAGVGITLSISDAQKRAVLAGKVMSETKEGKL